jgi:hypothetical protein
MHNALNLKDKCKKQISMRNNKNIELFFYV